MKNNKIVTALLAIAIAFGLWFYVVTVVKPDTTNTYYNIPVVLDGESILAGRDLMIVDGEDSTVTMELYGNRIDLDKVNSSNITLIADVTKIYDVGVWELPYNHRFPGDVPSGALSVQSKSPGTIKLTVDKREDNTVPVKVIWEGSVPEGFIVDTDNAILDNTEVYISGPKTVIDLIDHAMIKVNLTGREASFKETSRITLCDAAGNGVDVQLVTASVEEVSVQVIVEYLKEVKLFVEVLSGGGATRETSSIIIDPMSIQVSGDKSVLADLSEIKVGTINLGELIEAKDLVFTIPVPESLTNQSGKTEATVKVSFPNLGTKELSVTNIQALNVPEGMNYELLAKALKVTIRGPKNIVDKVSANDVTVTVDLVNALVGTATYKPVITVDAEKYPDVGVIGVYTVGVTLKEGVEAASEITPE